MGGVEEFNIYRQLKPEGFKSNLNELIYFGLLYHQGSMPELIQKLSAFFSFHPQTPTIQQLQTNAQKPSEALEPKIKVIAAKPITNPSLCRYLTAEKISFDITEKLCKEVDFELNRKRNLAIGFENTSGGFELRNPLFKGSSSSKHVSYVATNTAKEVAVSEGFFGFLSYQTLLQQEPPLTNFLVLNSIAFFKKSRQLMEAHKKIYLYLDRDQSGVKNIVRLRWDEKYIDKGGYMKIIKT